MRSKPTAVFVRYIVSGSLAAMTHFGVLALLVEVMDTDPTLASAIGFVAALFVNYSMQYHWTFAAEGPHGVIFTRYVVVTFSMLGLNTVLFWSALNAMPGNHYLIAQCVATGVVVLLNFTLNSRYTFNTPVKCARPE